MILGQHKAAQCRPEVAIHPARQRRHDQLPIRGQPALPAIADAAGPQDQVLSDEICVALEPRAGWRSGREDPILDSHARRCRATAALGRAERLRLAGLFHPPRFERWPALEPFQSRDLCARWAATVCSSAATLPSSSMTSAFSSVGESAYRSPGEAMLLGNQRAARQRRKKRHAATCFSAGTKEEKRPMDGDREIKAQAVAVKE